MVFFVCRFVFTAPQYDSGLVVVRGRFVFAALQYVSGLVAVRGRFVFAALQCASGLVATHSADCSPDVQMHQRIGSCALGGLFSRLADAPAVGGQAPAWTNF